MVESPHQGPRESPHKSGTNRLAVTLGLWSITAGLFGLGWLVAEDPIIGLGLTHPIILTQFGFCAAIGLTKGSRRPGLAWASQQ
jgi:hypothetical protein